MSYVVKRRFRLIENRSATRTATTTTTRLRKQVKKKCTNNNSKKCDALYVRFCRVNKIMILGKKRILL